MRNRRPRWKSYGSGVYRVCRVEHKRSGGFVLSFPIVPEPPTPRETPPVYDEAVRREVEEFEEWEKRVVQEREDRWAKLSRSARYYIASRDDDGV